MIDLENRINSLEAGIRVFNKLPFSDIIGTALQEVIVLGCRRGQGYLIARPALAESIPDLLRTPAAETTELFLVNR